jgi:hypothetical protein
MVGAAVACSDESPNSADRNQPAFKAGCNPFTEYRAEVEVSSGGVTRQGLIIVTHDAVYLEQLDENVARYIHGAIRPKPTSPMGWDDRPLRASPVRIVWGRLGQTEVLAEIHTPDATIRVTQHRLLSAR